MDLFILRHAWAEERSETRWPDDGLRPLTAEGRDRMAKVVGKLADAGMGPELIATSPLVRCRQTADIVAGGVAREPPVVELAALVPGSDLDALVEWTAGQAEEHEAIAWVGHAPDVDLLCAELIGSGEGLIRFAKGAAACVRFDEEIAPGRGELRWLVTAKVLGC